MAPAVAAAAALLLACACAHAAATADPVPLDLCDCEPATGDPGPGLSCDKEGFFITSFEREGQWLAGGGVVPLTRAVCCRPCLPRGRSAAPTPALGRRAPASAPTAPRADALAVLSLDCHPAPADGPNSLLCEAGTGGFVAGWARAADVPSLPGAAYPLGPPRCCTPALLAPSGEVAELVRCDCAPAAGVACGGNSTGRLLRGFQSWRVSGLGELVPAAPAECCRACVGGGRDTEGDCGGCSGRGACVLGECVCPPAWAGPDCGTRSADADLPAWQSLLALAGALALLAVAASAARAVWDARAAGDADDEGEPLVEPLVVRLAGGPGSVGSLDTDDGEEGDGEGREWGVEGAGGDGSALADASALDAAATPLPAPDPASTPSPGAGGDVPLAPQPGRRRPPDPRTGAPRTPSPAPRADADSGASPPKAAAAASSDGDDDAKGAASPQPPPAGDAAAALLAAACCSVCLERPVQVVLVPCGHACTCRRCARRLARCPVCRTETARRQRLFVGG